MNQYTCHAEFNAHQYPWSVKAQNLGHAENAYEQWLWMEYNLTKDCADELLARVGQAEARLASAAITGSGAYPSEALNKFAIEKKIEGAKEYTAYCQYSPTDSNRKEWSEQLRKEQEQCQHLNIQNLRT